MKRREFIALVGGAAAAWPLAARAQQRAMPVIGFLNGGSSTRWAHLVAAYQRGLNEAGYSEDQNVAIEYRWAEGQYDRLPSLVAELVGRSVAVIVTTDIPSSLAAQAATKTVPIVFAIGGDAVKLGLVDNYSRPGGNLTGVSVLLMVLGPKRLELLSELLPTAGTIAILVNTTHPNARAEANETQGAADALGRHLEVLSASTESDLEVVFATMIKQKASAVIVTADPFLIGRREQVIALAARHALPAIYPIREFVEVGGLMSYGPPVAEVLRQVGTHTAKILRGAKPTDLPVEQATKLQLTINLKSAKALGLTVPQSLLARADEVIE
jgi:putative ABC transport system substrate-binding protein